jgi:hypothetical protein
MVYRMELNLDKCVYAMVKIMEGEAHGQWISVARTGAKV